MRTFFLSTAIILSGSLCNAQKIMQVETYGKPRAEKIFIGDAITYQLRGEDSFRSSFIEDIRVKDSLLVLSGRYLKIQDISALQYERSWPRATGISLFWFGIGWSGFAAIGTALDGNPDTQYQWSDAIVSASAITLAFTIPPLFKNKTIRMGKRKRLRLLDLRFKKEPWED